jgi:hypothetical protein
MHQRQAGCAAGTALSHQHAQMKIKASERVPSLSLWSVCVLGGSADGVCARWQMVCSTRPKFTHHLFKFRACRRHHLFAIQTVRYLLTTCARDALCANIIIDISRRRRQSLAPHDAPAPPARSGPQTENAFLNVTFETLSLRVTQTTCSSLSTSGNGSPLIHKSDANLGEI